MSTFELQLYVNPIPCIYRQFNAQCRCQFSTTYTSAKRRNNCYVIRLGFCYAPKIRRGSWIGDCGQLSFILGIYPASGTRYLCGLATALGSEPVVIISQSGADTVTAHLSPVEAPWWLPMKGNNFCVGKISHDLKLCISSLDGMGPTN